MFLKILAHPVFVQLNFHMPMIVDLSYPIVMLTGENGCGKSTLLHSIKIALDGAEAPSYVYRLEKDGIDTSSSFLFDAELHNPRTQLEYFSDQPEMQDFLRTASHGQIMLSLFRETFPKMPDGSILLLDEPEMALSVSNQSRILKMLLELVDQKKFRIICATHSPVLTGAKETYVINLDNHTNKNIMPEDQGREGQSTIQ
jgi:predicted ATPase